MGDVVHQTIGKNQQEREHIVVARDAFREQLVRRYTQLPWKKISLDQAIVWFALGTAAASAFLFCTVRAVMVAVR